MEPQIAARSRQPRWVYPTVAAWLLATTACMALLWRYKARPGEAATAPTHWPTTSTIPRDSDLPTLVMFTHPECPCTRASLEELSEVMAQVGGKVHAWVLLVRPPGVGRDWDDTEMRQQAQAIRGVTVRTDVDGQEAERFGAHVSGQVLLYDASGALAFAGGITGSRGHVGNNVGRQRVISLIASHTADAPTAYVYGCDLLGEARR
jgi:hypothetical protein